MQDFFHLKIEPIIDRKQVFDRSPQPFTDKIETYLEIKSIIKYIWYISAMTIC